MATFREETEALAEQVKLYDEIAEDIREKVPAKRLRQLAHDPLLLPQLLIDCRFSVTAVRALADVTGTCSEFDAERIVRANGMHMRLMYATIAYGIKAHDQESYAERKTKRLLNDYNDRDIAVVGTFTEAVVTADPMPIYVDAAVRACVQQLPRFPDNWRDLLAER